MFQNLFSLGFRPFFLLSSLSAFIFPLLWVAIFNADMNWNNDLISAMSWHAHEMLYGVVGALVAGFLLTATANWTGKRPVQGGALILLCCFWILERLSFYLPSYVFIPLNFLFPVTLIFFIVRTLWGNQRNVYIISMILTLFFLGKFLLIYGELNNNGQVLAVGKYLSIGALRFLFILILSRVLPFFSSKRFPDLSFACPQMIQMLHLISFFIIIIPWEDMGYPVVQLLLNFVALLFLILRIPFYQPHRTYKEPMILVLSFGLIWPFLGLLFSILGYWYDDFRNNFLNLHAFAAGAVGTIGLGMMCRVSLGHSGRNIRADAIIIFIFLLATAGAILRVFAPFLGFEIYQQVLYFAAASWSFAFLLYFIRFIKILVGPRLL